MYKGGIRMAEKERKAIALKKQQVKETVNLLKSKKVVGIVDLHMMPSPQFQEIKKKLRGKAQIKVVRKVVLEKALADVKDEKIALLKNYTSGSVALLISDEDPFKLFKFLKQNRSKTETKTGMIAPFDIVVPAGETDLPAGPALADLKTAKIEVKIDKGKIVVSKDSEVAKKGEAINAQVANALGKLGIKPIEIGMKVNALLENGIMFTPETLDINEEEFISKIQTAHIYALNLAVGVSYYTNDSTKVLLQKAAREAFNLAVSANILTSETVKLILGKASMQANALQKLVPAATP